MYSTSFLCGHGAAEPLILHNHTNGCDELFRLSYGSVIFYAIHLEDLLCFPHEGGKYPLFRIPAGTKYQNASSRKRRAEKALHLPPASRLGVTLNINTSAVIRKIAKEAVSPSLSSFEGHFTAQRQMPNTLPERGAQPLSHRGLAVQQTGGRERE